MTTTLASQRVSRVAVGSGALACVMVGGSVPVTGMLDGYPILAAQSMRYLLGGLLLMGWAYATGRRLVRVTGRDLPSLVGLAATGMLGFNACLLLAQRYADPGFVAAVLGGTPLVLALVAPLMTGRRPAPLVLAGASLVVGGIVVLSGGGAWHGPGLLLALLTMAGEASFTLLAVRVVGRLGGFSVATWCCFIAGVGGAVLATAVGGGSAWRAPDGRQLVALLILATLVTAVGFCCWYRAVSDLGADRAGILVGLMPVAGLVVSVSLGAQPLTLTSCVGVALVTTGCVLGLRH